MFISCRQAVSVDSDDDDGEDTEECVRFHVKSQPVQVPFHFSSTCVPVSP